MHPKATLPADTEDFCRVCVSNEGTGWAGGGVASRDRPSLVLQPTWVARRRQAGFLLVRLGNVLALD